MDTFIGAACASADGKDDSSGRVGQDVFVLSAVTSGDIDDVLGVDRESRESRIGRAWDAHIVISLNGGRVVVLREVIWDFVWNDDGNVVLVEVLIEDDVSWVERSISVIDADTIRIFDFGGICKGNGSAIWDGADAEAFEVAGGGNSGGVDGSGIVWEQVGLVLSGSTTGGDVWSFVVEGFVGVHAKAKFLDVLIGDGVFIDDSEFTVSLLAAIVVA